MSLRLFLSLLFGALAITLVACDSGEYEPEFDREPARIYMLSQGDASIIVSGSTVTGRDLRSNPGPKPPARVQAGVPFPVTTYTFTGDDACFRAGPSTVTLGEQEARIEVFDDAGLFIEGDTACSLQLIYRPRTDSLVFDTPGTAQVTVAGLGDDIPQNNVHTPPLPYEITFPVIVE